VAAQGGGGQAEVQRGDAALHSARGPGQGKKAKKTKDPNAPKRATTAYFFFLADERPRTKEEVPGISVTELSKVVGAKWKELSDADKAPYEAKAEADKARYAEEKAAYESKQAAAAEEAVSPAR